MKPPHYFTIRRSASIVLAISLLLATFSACTLSAAPTPPPSPTSTATPSPTPTSTASLSPTPTNTDGGENWSVTNDNSLSNTATAAPTPSLPPIVHLAAGHPVMVTSIKMLDATTGWAIGYGEADVEGQASRVLLTTDSGNTWSDVTPSTSPGEHIEYYFGDNNHAWATEIFGSGLVKLWRTQDGGQTWLCNEDIGDILSGTGINPRSVQLTFVDSQTGWMLASSGSTLGSGVVTILATQDGGESWKVVQAVDGSSITTLPLNGRKSDISFITGQVGWVGGSTMSSITYLYKTTDGGYSWQSVALPPPLDKPELFPFDPHTPVPEGDSDVVAHSFLFTSAPHFSSPQTGFLVVQFAYSPENKCGAIAYITANGGQTWTGYLLPPKDLDDGGLCGNTNLDFVNAQVGWYIGSKTNSMGDVEHYQLYQTQNGGQTWTLLTDLVWTGQIDFVDDQNGWAVATHGYTASIESEYTLMRTSDGGKTWQEMKPQIVE